jgi:hypothetical protein
MALVKTDPFSQVPLFIKMKFGSTELASGTAFFYQRNNSLFLISNWHNYSGRNPLDRKPLSLTAGLPDTISCYICRNEPYIQREWLDLPLHSDDEAYWYEHPTLGRNVDIGALPVTLDEHYKAIVINNLPYTEMTLRVSHDVFILGYPLGILNNYGLPIWKRASVASEPGTSEPKFYVDTATRSGMSGSPVLFRYRGFYKHDQTSHKVGLDDWLGEGDMFVGIYSGRIGASEVEAQLGIVWKSHLIDEIIDGQVKAKIE